MRSPCRVPRTVLRGLLLAALLWTPEPLATSAQTHAAADCGATPYDCAVVQVQRQEFAAAIRTLERLVAESPRNLRVLNLLGIALTGAGRPDDANGRFRQALAIDPRFTPALKNLAVNEFMLGRQDEAQRHFDEVLALTPDDEIAHVHLGEIQFERKEYRAALTHYEKSRARVVQNPRWILQYATCLLELNRKTDATALLDQLPPDEATSWFSAGVTLGRYGAYSEAARFFGAARAKGYKDAYAAGHNETLMLINAGDNEGAIRTARELIAAGKGPAELYSLVSRAYTKTNQIKEAYDALREATRLEPDVAEHYIDLAMLCLEHENYDLGLEIVDIGLKYRPDSSMLYLQRGVVVAMKGSVEQAETEFTKANRAAPEDPAPYVALAMVWMQRGQTTKAIEVLRTRARVTTQAGTPHAVILYALGIALIRSGAAPDDADSTEALHAFLEAVRLQPAFVQAQAELGKLLLKRGDVAAAISHLERAIALEPGNAAPAYVLAQAYRRNGQLDRARDLLARVSRLNAQERGDDPDTDLRRMMFRIVRDDSRQPASNAPSTAAASANLRPSSAPAVSSVPPLVALAAAEAGACAAKGDLDGAIVRLRQVVEATPAFADARYQLAVALWNRYQRAGGRRQKADLDEAVSALSRAVEQVPYGAHFQLVLGQLFAEQLNFGPGIEHLRRAVALAPANPEHAYNLGLALRLQGDLDAAETQFRAALASTPDHGLARRSLGLVLRQRGDISAAAIELRRAAAQLPDDAQGHHLLGTVLLKLGDVPAAMTELREAIRLDTSLTEARVMLAQALAKQGQKDEALRQQAEVQRINAEKADFGRALVLLESAAALMANGDVAGAIARRREVVAMSPGFADAHYELGLALREVEELRVEAESAFRQAITLDPEHARAFDALGRLLETRGDEAGARAARARAAELAPCSLASR
jgi:tetratricopeptide (TPR) repeat protein